MGWYSRHVMPRVVGFVCSRSFFDPWRAQALEGLEGDVLEIGMGSGANLAHYPSTVRRIVGAEPDALARRRALARPIGPGTTLEFARLDDGGVEMADATVDHVVCSFTLCTVDDPRATLHELHRVVRPGGSLRLLEHGRAPDDATQRWQRRLDSWERRWAGGCSLIRDPLEILESSPWVVETCSQSYARGPRPWSYFSVIRARRPA